MIGALAKLTRSTPELPLLRARSRRGRRGRWGRRGVTCLNHEACSVDCCPELRVLALSIAARSFVSWRWASGTAVARRSTTPRPKPAPGGRLAVQGPFSIEITLSCVSRFGGRNPRISREKRALPAHGTLRSAMLPNVTFPGRHTGSLTVFRTAPAGRPGAKSLWKFAYVRKSDSHREDGGRHLTWYRQETRRRESPHDSADIRTRDLPKGDAPHVVVRIVSMRIKLPPGFRRSPS